MSQLEAGLRLKWETGFKSQGRKFMSQLEIKLYIWIIVGMFMYRYWSETVVS